MTGQVRVRPSTSRLYCAKSLPMTTVRQSACRVTATPTSPKLEKSGKWSAHPLWLTHPVL